MPSLYERLRYNLLPRVAQLRLPRRRRDDLQKLGTVYGGWVVPTSMLNASSVCYCVGVGEDISFDLALIERFGCHVYAFDPTPRSIRYIEKVSPPADRFHFSPFGLWSSDTTMRFYAPPNPAHVSHSIVNLRGTSDYFEAVCKSLQTMMREQNHQSIDLLKLDIEGAEYEVLDHMLREKIFPNLLCIEFDQPAPFAKTMRQVRELIARGYDIVDIDQWNYTLVRRT